MILLILSFGRNLKCIIPALEIDTQEEKILYSITEQSSLLYRSIFKKNEFEIFNNFNNLFCKLYVFFLFRSEKREDN